MDMYRNQNALFFRRSFVLGGPVTQETFIVSADMQLKTVFSEGEARAPWEHCHF